MASMSYLQFPAFNFEEMNKLQVPSTPSTVANTPNNFSQVEMYTTNSGCPTQNSYKAKTLSQEQLQAHNNVQAKKRGRDECQSVAKRQCVGAQSMAPPVVFEQQQVQQTQFSIPQHLPQQQAQAEPMSLGLALEDFDSLPTMDTTQFFEPAAPFGNQQGWVSATQSPAEYQNGQGYGMQPAVQQFVSQEVQYVQAPMQQQFMEQGPVYEQPMYEQQQQPQFFQQPAFAGYQPAF